MRKGSTIAAVVSSIFPTVLFILLGLKADCTAVYSLVALHFQLLILSICLRFVPTKNDS